MDHITHLHNAGINPADVDLSRVGVWQRLPTTDKPRRRNGRVMVFQDRPLRFWYRNEATGLSGYFAEEGGFASKMDLRQLAMAREESDRQRAEAQSAAAEKATKAWQESEPADPAHPYLVRKQIQPHGLRQSEDEYLIVPMRSGGLIWSIQTIDWEGNKRYLPGGRKTGCYFGIGGAPTDALLICEGFATGASLFECLAIPVAVAFDCSNLLPVGQALRKRYPHLRLIFCADDDRHTASNPGLAHAKAAATATRGYVAYPMFGSMVTELTDFNDMAVAYGPEFVREHFRVLLEEWRVAQ